MNELTPLLEQLAIKFNTTAEHLWGVMVVQAPINATVHLGLFSIFYCCFFIAIKIARKKWDGWSNDQHISFYLIAGLSSLILAIGVAHDAELIITGYLNPEYWALMQIRQFL